jgi:hypothetical protein
MLLSALPIDDYHKLNAFMGTKHSNDGGAIQNMMKLMAVNNINSNYYFYGR